MQSVLVVDDEPLIRRELREALQHCGYEVWEACNGQQALTIFKENHPAAIVTDILMPNRDGIELIREVRAQAADVSIIAISSGGSYGFKKFLSYAKKLGADLAYEKPININRVLADLEISLSQSKR